MKEKLSKLFTYLHNRGIPLPLFRHHGKGSFTATTYWLSASLVLLGSIGAINEYLKISVTDALYWFGASAALHLGRKFIGRDGVEVEKDESSKKRKESVSNEE